MRAQTALALRIVFRSVRATTELALSMVCGSVCAQTELALAVAISSAGGKQLYFELSSPAQVTQVHW